MVHINTHALEYNILLFTTIYILIGPHSHGLKEKSSHRFSAIFIGSPPLSSSLPSSSSLCFQTPFCSLLRYHALRLRTILSISSMHFFLSPFLQPPYLNLNSLLSIFLSLTRIFSTTLIFARSSFPTYSFSSWDVLYLWYVLFSKRRVSDHYCR